MVDTIKIGIMLFLGLLMATLLTGCGVRQFTRGDIQPPQVTLQAVTLGLPKPKAGAWPLSFTLLLDNPNAEEVRVSGYDFELLLEDRVVAQGADDKPVTLPARGQTVVEVPVLLPLRPVLALLPGAFLEKERRLRYQLAGGVRVPSLLGLRVPFQFQGHITPREGLEYLRSFFHNPTDK